LIECSNITDACFHDLTSLPETIWALFASFLHSFGYVEMATEPSLNQLFDTDHWSH